MSNPNANRTFLLAALAILIAGALIALAIFKSNSIAPPAPVAQTQNIPTPPEPLPLKITPATLAATKSLPAPQLPVATASAPAPKSLEASQIFAAASPAVVRITTNNAEKKPIALGSGFFVSDSGLIVTNYHVIKGGSSATIIFSNETKLDIAGVLAIDEKYDLAVLSVPKIAGDKYPVLPLENNPALQIGARVYAIGNPQGLTNTFSEGIISSLRSDAAGDIFAIQTTAPISSGSSGGALLSAEGKVIGVTTGTREEGQNLNFAIPTAKILQLLKNQKELSPLSSPAPRNKDRDALGLLAAGNEDIANKKYDSALTKFRSAILLKPDFPEAYQQIGSVYAAQEKLDDALKAYDAALVLNPNFAAAHLSRGVILARQNKNTAALAAFTKARDLDPTGEAGQKAADFIAKFPNQK